MSRLSLFLLLLVLAIFIIGYLTNYADAFQETIWVGGEKGLRQITIYYVEILETCNDSSATDTRGCYRSQDDKIEIRIDSIGMWATAGCDVRQHEILHAWGINHGIAMAQYNCENPHEPDWNSLQYDPTNTKHRDPMYVHIPIDPNPKMVSWYVGR